MDGANYFNQMEKICGIYKITSPSNKIYIGQSVNIKRRISEYKNFNSNKYLIHNSIKKHGWENHTFEIIEQCLPKELNEKEKYYVTMFQSFNSKHGLNLKEGGGNKVNLSESTKNKIRQKAIGRKHSEEAKNKMSKSHKYMSNELRNKISLAHKGKPKSLEQRKKMSISQKGRIITSEQRIKISNALKYRKRNPFTQEHKTKISLSNMGKKFSNETKNRMSISQTGMHVGIKNVMFGKKHTQQTKNKISKARKLYFLNGNK